MVKHTQASWMAKTAEDNYSGGGSSGAARSETVLIQGELAAVQACKRFVEGGTLPLQEKAYECNSDVDPIATVNTGRIYKNPQLIQYVQADDWIVEAFSDNTPGTSPSSWAFHTYDGIEHREHFGCQVKEYTLEIFPGNAFPIQTTTFLHRKTKYGSGDGVSSLTKVAFSSSTILTRKDFTLTIDAEVLQVESWKLTIRKILDETIFEQNGGDYRYDGTLLKREVELGIMLWELGTNTLADIKNSTKQDQAVLIDTTGNVIDIDLAGMYYDANLRENLGEIPEFGNRKFDLVLVNGENFSFTDQS